MADRKDIMLCYPYTEKLFKRLGCPLIVQPKIEGDRLRAVLKEDRTTLYSSSAAVRTSLPHIRKVLDMSLPYNIELDGEAYKHGWKHNQIRSVVGRTKNLHPNHVAIEYWVYDIVSDTPQNFRLAKLQEMAVNYPMLHIKYVPFRTVRSIDEMQIWYDRFLARGFEGIIIRSFNAPYVRKQTVTMLKLKPRLSEYFEIVDVVEEKDKNGILKGSFGAFTCVTQDRKETFNVGSGPTDLQRELLWKHRHLLRGHEIKVRFQGYTNARNVPKMQSIDTDWLKIMTKVLP